jgi:hypothetical protein
MFSEFLIPDQTYFYPGIRIRIFFHPVSGSLIRIPEVHYEFKYFNPKKWFLSSRKYDPGCSFRIPDPYPDFLPIPDPGVKKEPVPDPAPQRCTIHIRYSKAFLYPSAILTLVKNSPAMLHSGQSNLLQHYRGNL